MNLSLRTETKNCCKYFLFIYFVMVPLRCIQLLAQFNKENISSYFNFLCPCFSHCSHRHFQHNNLFSVPLSSPCALPFSEPRTFSPYLSWAGFFSTTRSLSACVWPPVVEPPWSYSPGSSLPVATEILFTCLLSVFPSKSKDNWHMLFGLTY